MKLIPITICLLLLFVKPALADSYLDNFCSKQIIPTQDKEKYVEKLISDLKNKHSIGNAADSLSCLGEAATPAIQSMIELFNTPSGEERLNIIVAVAHIGKPAVSALTAALSSKDKDIRRGACIALGEIGPQAKPALFTLNQLLREPGYDVSLEAERAINKIMVSNGK